MKEITIKNFSFKFETFSKMKGLKYFFIKDMINDETSGDVIDIDDVIQLRNFLNDVIEKF